MFEGITYRLSSNWNEHVPLDLYSNKAINYLEIGTFYGANIINVAKTYGSHPDSKLYCIDPWSEDINCKELEGKWEDIYNTFIRNVNNSGNKDKIIVNRGWSYNEIPKFQDEFFDIIYVDGYHEAHNVLEDAVLSFRKLKTDGILIFDDYAWGGSECGIDAFLKGYHKKIIKLGEKDYQVFVKKVQPSDVYKS
jgi:predicted O-methyltransferase YrrM